MANLHLIFTIVFFSNICVIFGPQISQIIHVLQYRKIKCSRKYYSGQEGE
ncbi:MAG: hypothetical protein HPY66_3059 [Firmicutes bacterium]|nr:hypothetical protein [Bacillota bacterium]